MSVGKRKVSVAVRLSSMLSPELFTQSRIEGTQVRQRAG